MSRRVRFGALAAFGAAVVVMLAALLVPRMLSHSDPLPAACRAAQAQEFAVARADQTEYDAATLAAQYSMAPRILKDEQQAADAMTAAGCPGTARIESVTF